ncbi:MAG: hypothetical protein ABR981_00325 [Candidatus Micrarchaeaceae archaeon]|jgi:hypothetical protein
MELNRTIGVASVEWSRKIRQPLHEELSYASGKLSFKLKGQLLQTYVLHRNDLHILVPTTHTYEPYHTEITKYSLGLKIVEEINESLKNYYEMIKGAIDNQQSIAKEQTWSVAKFDDVMSLIEEDVVLHTKGIKELLLSFDKNLPDKKNYEELVGAAALLLGGINAISANFTEHLEGIARHGLLREEPVHQ